MGPLYEIKEYEKNDGTKVLEYKPWSVGASRYAMLQGSPQPISMTIKAVIVPHTIQGAQLPQYVSSQGAVVGGCILDTGAHTSIVALDWAQASGFTVSNAKMQQRIGGKSETLRPISDEVRVFFVADEGADVVIKARFCAVEGWDWPPLLGVRGCLNRLRLALEPWSESEGLLRFAPRGDTATPSSGAQAPRRS
jgi:hypothetical protein